MKIFTHFSNLTLTSDQHSALEKLEAFLESEDSIFMLKGYAGTGKTTLIKGLVSYLSEQKRDFQVMAPTGRAAKILREKTGFEATTIHKGIYAFDDVEFIKDEKEKVEGENYQLHYPIKNIDKRNSVLIIDEASMISSRKNEHPFLQFGTEILLSDLLTFAKPYELKTKVIFVGDPAQLPPVGDNKSWAFEPRLFKSKGLSVVEVELKEVKRQSNNLILQNATLLRQKIDETNPTELAFSYDKSSFVKLTPYEIVDKYIDEFPIPEINSGVIISFSNAQCYHNNIAVRERYFPNYKNVAPGDIIQIIGNNYNTPVDIFNGDFAKVLSVSNEVINQTAPIFVEEKGKRIQKNITLHYRKVNILVDHSDTPFDCMIIDSLLNSTDRELTIDEMKSMYINFIIRFDEEQRNNKANGKSVYKRYSEEFKTMMINDPFLNAVKCKYGYAITCHKAQGGEWQKVFVDYIGRISLKQEPLRWCYTATTRGIETCFAINTPHFTRFSKFKIHEITQFGNIPKDAFSFDNVQLSPYHSENQHRCKSKKYWDVVEALENTNYRIKDVLSRDYLEKYTLSNGIEDVVVEGHHNGAGVFTKGFKVTTNNSIKIQEEVEQLFNQTIKINFRLNYSPTLSVLDELYSAMQSICEEINVAITNVIEFVNNNYVIYFLQTDSISSNIQFYFNKNEQMTVAMPKTYKCDDDKKLKLLLTKLEEYVF